MRKSTFLFLIGILAMILAGCSDWQAKTPTPTSEAPTNTPLPESVVLESWYNEKVEEEYQKDHDTSFNRQYLDLDTGAISNNPIGEIYYTVSCGSQCFGMLRLAEGIEAREFGYLMPNYQLCVQLLNDPRITYKHLGLEPYYSCVRTDQGTIAWVRVGHGEVSAETREEFGGYAAVGSQQITYQLLHPGD